MDLGSAAGGPVLPVGGWRKLGHSGMIHPSVDKQHLPIAYGCPALGNSVTRSNATKRIQYSKTLKHAETKMSAARLFSCKGMKSTARFRMDVAQGPGEIEFSEELPALTKYTERICQLYDALYSALPAFDGNMAGSQFTGFWQAVLSEVVDLERFMVARNFAWDCDSCRICEFRWNIMFQTLVQLIIRLREGSGSGSSGTDGAAAQLLAGLQQRGSARRHTTSPITSRAQTHNLWQRHAHSTARVRHRRDPRRVAVAVARRRVPVGPPARARVEGRRG